MGSLIRRIFVVTCFLCHFFEQYQLCSCPAVMRQFSGIVRHLSGSLQAVNRQSSVSQLVVQQSSCSCQTVVRHQQAVFRNSTPVVRQSSGSQQAVSYKYTKSSCTGRVQEDSSILSQLVVSKSSSSKFFIMSTEFDKNISD